MGPLLLNKMALKICFFLLTFALQTIVLCDAKTTAERLAKGFEKKITWGSNANVRNSYEV